MNKGLIDFAQLESLPLSAAARKLLEACTPFSDSGLESIVFRRLRWLKTPLRQQAHMLCKRVDLLIGRKLVVQMDGATHTGAQRDSDIRHDAELHQRGYTVVRVSYHQVMHQWEATEGLILQAIARGLHL